MKNQLIAALLLSSAVFAAAPAFAGNANLGDDVENWSGPSVTTRAEVRQELIASEQADKYSHTTDNISYPTLVENGPGKTRAEVKQELADAAAKGELNNDDNINYPSRSDLANVPAAPSAHAAVAQGNGLPTRSNP
jgi:hypothetical protein